MYSNIDIASSNYITRIVGDEKTGEVTVNFHIIDDLKSDKKKKTKEVKWYPTLCSKEVYTILNEFYEDNIRNVTSLSDTRGNGKIYLVRIEWNNSPINLSEVENGDKPYMKSFMDKYKSDISNDLQREIEQNIIGHFIDAGLTSDDGRDFMKTHKSKIDRIIKTIISDSLDEEDHDILFREGDLVREYIYDSSLPFPEID